MIICPVCSSPMQSDGKYWRCPFGTVQTQFEKHPGIERKDTRRKTDGGFICGECHSLSTVGEKIVVAEREKVYPFRREAHRYKDRDTRQKVVRDDPGGAGVEIAKEVQVCKPCFDKIKSVGVAGVANA